MAELVIMPKLGFNMSSGKLVKWYKSEGEKINKGEPFFSVETDKTNIDIESTSDNFVRKLLISEGETVKVTLPIAILGSKEESIDDLISEGMSKLDKKEKDKGEVSGEQKVDHSDNQMIASASDTDKSLKISPRARKTVKEKNIDIKQLDIKGTGYQGGICEKDILKAAEIQALQKVKISPLADRIAAAEGIDVSTVTGTGAGNKIMKRDVEASKKYADEVSNQNEFKGEVQHSNDGKEILEITPYEGVRQVIGNRMVQSKFTAPHVYFTKAVDLTEILKLRKQINNSHDVKTSVTDYVAMAVIKALQKYPEVNASLQSDKIYKYKTVNLGIAVAAPNGLIVPVIKDAEKKGIMDFSEDAAEMIKKARDGKLMPSEYSGGTFTISNLGMFGIDNFTAIINQPESAILAVSATQKMPVVVTNEKEKDEIVIRPMMNITLTVDHRIIDGLLAAQFTVEVKRYMENPMGLLI